MRPRELAHQDVEAVIDYYVREAGSDVALGFIDALQATFRSIAQHPPQERRAMRMSLRFPGCAAAG